MRTLSKIILSLMVFSSYGTSFAELANIQSTFQGPVELSVWKHWQASWNVELLDKDYLFELQRGFDHQNQPLMQLKFRSNQEGLLATFKSSGLKRHSQWEMKETSFDQQRVAGETDGTWAYFILPAAEHFVDRFGELIVKEISFTITKGEETIFSYNLRPMYVRGKNISYWKNSIDPTSAHNGSGNYQITTSMLGEAGWDKWGGQVVKPQLQFMERNTVSTETEVGLHRHLANQEMYLVEEGKFLVRHGVAKVTGEEYTIDRRWNSEGDIKETKQFNAAGGWVEERIIVPGDFFVIVPNGNNTVISFHGIQTIEGGVFWTMGTKN